MTKVYFAPLQGYTDCAFRKAHHKVVGGVEEYYTPFVRWERNGLRRKDERDIDRQRNEGVPTAIQVIARDRDEFARLCDAVQSLGWRRIDLNMGCPFPMQMHGGHGCGLLPHPDIVATIAEEMLRRPEVSFSIKMRLGQEDAEECMVLQPIIDAMPLKHVALHPRTGVQQYRGKADWEAFGRYCATSRQPMVYNGDITTREQVAELLRLFPQMHGVMVGRGLLARPALFADIDDRDALMAMAKLVQEHTARFQEESQVKSRMKAFWEYAEPVIGKRLYKEKMKGR